ncbi:hypothetical protein DXX93_12195 [Thalassotalea euphylliae]|uniref:Uncharacterized protein n=1 Tax=Thalassotalea euphylliae TaxID=1655234 RepID=A0A3E0TRH0_9GAMM|nr:hypothetical protein [Thalassotalea euphylliae]REL27251.1 hypothetical protein DXX93_12195 [Thalassotalea euphylliae]
MSKQAHNQQKKAAHKSDLKPECKGGKPRLKESNDPMDLIRMQTEFALFESMLQSKTLTILVILAVVLFGSFFLFLYKMAGAA